MVAVNLDGYSLKARQGEPCWVAAFAALLALGCSPLPERPADEVDCSTPEGVELRDPPPSLDFEVVEGDLGWWSDGDSTERAILLDPSTTLIDEAERCGSERALVLASEGHNDWGSAFGSYGLDLAPIDASGWEGLAVRVKAAPGTSRSVRLLLADRYVTEEGTIADPETGAPVPTCLPSPDPEAPPPEGPPPELRICYSVASGAVECGTFLLPGPREEGQICTTNAEGALDCGDGAVPLPHQCENAFGRPFTVTDRWERQLLPFDSFFQKSDPSRRSTGIDASAIHGITLAVPREAKLELYIDEITFYRHVE